MKLTNGLAAGCVVVAVLAGVAAIAALLLPMHDKLSQVSTTVALLAERQNELAVQIGSRETDKPQVSHATPTIPAMIPGWQVRVYKADRGSETAELADQDFAGEFRHTADWLMLNEHQRHAGVFVGDRAAFSMNGYFEPEVTGSYLFAAHLRVNRGGRSLRLGVRCRAAVSAGSGGENVSGVMFVDGNAEKAAFQGATGVHLEAGLLHPVSVMVACDVPEGINPSDVMIRICVRETGEVSFRPIRSLTPHI